MKFIKSKSEIHNIEKVLSVVLNEDWLSFEIDRDNDDELFFIYRIDQNRQIEFELKYIFDSFVEFLKNDEILFDINIHGILNSY